MVDKYNNENINISCICEIRRGLPSFKLLKLYFRIHLSENSNVEDFIVYAFYEIFFFCFYRIITTIEKVFQHITFQKLVYCFFFQR